MLENVSKKFIDKVAVLYQNKCMYAKRSWR